MIVYNNVMLKQFPKHEKYLLANKIRDIGYTLLEITIAINKKFHKKTDLTLFNVKHECLRQLVNLAFELQYIDSRKHRTASVKIDEVGRMLGAWIKLEFTNQSLCHSERSEESNKKGNI